MSLILSRVVMTLAATCLGQRRRDWALAMEVEFEAVARDGRALSFSVGCLIAAWREMPAHAEGRLLLARYALALGLILPFAALLLWAALLGRPDLPHIGVLESVFGKGESAALVNDGNRAAAPVLMQLIAALAMMRLAIAWKVLDRDWPRVAALERLSAASTITLAVLAALARLDATRVALPTMALVAEVVAISALARLHDRLTLGGEMHDPF